MSIKLKILALLVLCVGWSEVSFSQKIDGKFAPVDGRTLMVIGQDLGSVKGYVDSGKFPTPGGVTMYTDLYSMSGLTDITNYGAGDIGSQEAMDLYPNSALSIGFWMREEADGQGEDHPNGLTELVNGQHDDELDKFTAFAKKNAPRPIYLRIGYEFDGNWNGYDANRYKAGYKYIVDYLRARNVDNVAYVWQSAAWGADPVNIIDNYYPGDEYVDYVGLSFFFYAEDYNADNLEYIINYAKDRNKPIMMAEVSCQYYEIDQGTYHYNGVTNLGSQGIWNQYFRDQLIPFIEDNDDIIRIICWINADWQAQPLWGNSGVHWGDTRLETDELISTNWNNYINNGDFLHGGPNLLADLGITNGPNCSDGIQNGDETGIDCGGSCAPCTTCNDGIQNGDETDIDCGGSCAPCPTCNDGIQNGNETGIDCGGPDCNDCPDGPSTSKIEAENASAQGSARVYNDGAASNGQGMAYLDAVGNGFTISNAPKADKVELIYASQNTGSISIVVNGNNAGKLNFTSNGAWVGNYQTVSIDVAVSQGASFQVVNQSGDVALNVDYLNFISNGSDDDDDEPCTGDDIPTATVSKTDESVQGANDGSITFSFGNTDGRTNIEFSIDGGNSYPYNAPDNSESTTINNLAPGTYNLSARWGNDECPNSLGSTTINAGDSDNDTCTACIDFDQAGTTSYSNQDGAANVSTQDNGRTIILEDNTWRKTNTRYNITANTIIEFEFQSTSQGEIHGIGFDADENLSSGQIFQLYGTQNWGNRDFDYTSSGYQSFRIPVGDYYTGNNMYLVIVNDFDEGSSNTSYFRNVRIFEDSDTPATCDDGIQNGDETGIDCGGSNCEPCTSCNDGVQNGNETGIDCGGPDCEPCSSCNDGIQNGSETGIDCGGPDCQPCSDSLAAKLLPPNSQILLTIGQDLKTLNDYNNTSSQNGFPTMGGTTTYISFYSILSSDFPQYGALGETTNGDPALGNNGSSLDVDWGAGPLNARSTILGYPESSLSIGLSMTEGENTADGVNYWCQGCMAQVGQGQWDQAIRRLATFCKKYGDKAIYLRIGYEFDGNWNVGYENRTNYINAYRRVVDVMRQEGVDNVAYVWQSSSSPVDDVLDIRFGEGDFGDISSWYPGDNYVDWMGLSWFLNADEVTNVEPGIPTQKQKADEVVEFAREKNKPVYIAESTPQGYDLVNTNNCNVSNVWDGTAAQGCVNKSGNQIWNEWFTPFFDYIYDNQDVIRHVHYINANWEDDTALFGQGNRANGYWGRAGVQANGTIANNWRTEMEKSVWLHGSSSLNSLLLQSRIAPPSTSKDPVETNKNSVILYPNPSQGIVTIKAKNLSTIRISDINGRVITKITITDDLNERVINLNNVEKGVYFVSTLDANNAKVVKRLIIK